LLKGLSNRYPLIYVQSREEHRLERQMEELSRIHYGDDRPVAMWSAALGLSGRDALTNPLDVIHAIRVTTQEGFYLLRDLPALLLR
jgi:hypothetical protein